MKSLAVTAVLITFSLLIGGLGSARADEAMLRPGDKIHLEIKGVPDEEKTDLNGDYTVGENGTIPLPYIDDPIAAGEKPSTLARQIATDYQNAQIYTNPTIVINADSDGSVRLISITGGVKDNGAVTYYDGLTLLDAISQAGGLTPFAKEKEVKLIRNSASSEHDMNAIVRDSRLDPTLLPGDKVVVPESGRKL
jgi:protein involved in polysaccharide export with SLBB domain